MGFADLHRPSAPLLLPNAWDYGSAAILAAQGFPAIGTTSLGWRSGCPTARVRPATRRPSWRNACMPNSRSDTARQTGW